MGDQIGGFRFLSGFSCANSEEVSNTSNYRFFIEI